MAGKNNSKKISTPKVEPAIPPIIIRGIIQQQQQPQQRNEHQPPRVLQQPQHEFNESLKAPAVPVHHIPPMRLLKQDSGNSSNDSDSDSSDESELQITTKSQPATPYLPQSSQSNLSQWSAIMPTPNIMEQPKLPFFNNQQLDPNLINKPNQIRYPIRPPANCRTIAQQGETVYCYCRCPYDELNPMIACDASDCPIEWFHFECVGIVIAPQDKWYCPQCRAKYLTKEELEKYNTQYNNYFNNHQNHQIPLSNVHSH